MDVDSGFNSSNFISNLSIEGLDVEGVHFQPDFVNALNNGSPRELVCELGFRDMLEHSCTTLDNNMFISMIFFFVASFAVRFSYDSGWIDDKTYIWISRKVLLGMSVASLTLIVYRIFFF